MHTTYPAPPGKQPGIPSPGWPCLSQSPLIGFSVFTMSSLALVFTNVICHATPIIASIHPNKTQVPTSPSLLVLPLGHTGSPLGGVGSSTLVYECSQEPLPSSPYSNGPSIVPNTLLQFHSSSHPLGLQFQRADVLAELFSLSLPPA